MDIQTLSAAEKALLKKALYKLGAHDYTRRALYDKLKRESLHGERVDKESAKAVVLWLVQNGYLDEADYFERLYPRLKARGYGPRRIAGDLRRRQFAQKYVDRAMCDEESARERAAQMAKKRVSEKLYDLSQTRDRQKLFAYLLRIGYDTQDAQSAVERAQGEAED